MRGKPDNPWIGTVQVESPRRRLAPPPRRGTARPLLVASAAAALGVSFGFGVLAIRNLQEPEPPEDFRAMSVTVPVEIAAPQPSPTPQPASAPMEVLPPTPAAVVATPPPPQARPETASASSRRADPGFSCRRPDSQSERLVCGNAELRQLHGGMNRAFDAAVADGVPYDSLRQDQDDWLRVREDAAQQDGVQGVAGMYRQRIAELKDMAESF